MKISNKQRNDLDCIRWFIPPKMAEPTEQDEINFLAYSDRGIKIGENTVGYKALLEGKSWRGVHCDTSQNNRAMYEEGILEGSVPYWVLLGGGNKKEVMPRYVVDYLKKSLFSGMDKDLIERVYQDVLWQWTPWYKKLVKIWKGEKV